ncbi:MAG: nuclear transport factor 2 family protein [Betaproteobacteria bacterium]|nr:nuclear transport factor 2 family protein [Betaproteobacteria bacterium]
MSQRDRAIVSTFASDALLVGSEAGEVARGTQQLTTFFERIFSRSVRFSWQWRRLEVASAGDMAWFFAEGEVIMSAEASTSRAPYRLSGVLQRQGGRWLWQQFHGAEPTLAQHAA